MKRNFCILLITALLISVFAGCAVSDTTAEAPVKPAAVEDIPPVPETEPEVNEEPAEIEEVVVEIPEEPVFDLYTNTISDELKAKAAAYPALDEMISKWRGVNIVNKGEFSWALVYTIPTNEETPYEDVLGTLDTTAFDETTVLEVAEAGYNFVRVCLDDRYFFTDKVSLDYTGQGFYGSIDTVNEEQYIELDNFIGWCIENGIHVCLDLHCTPGGLMIGGDEETTREPLFTEGSPEQDIFVRFWEIIANRYADIDIKALSFNLYNEPPNFVTEKGMEDVYINLCNRAIDKIQEKTPDRLIVVDNLSYSTVGLDKVDELKANNLLMSFHIYTEDAQVEDASEYRASRNIKELKDRLLGYKEWADSKNVRWMLQEYGTTVFLTQEDQKEYLTTLTDICKEYGVSYCIYAFSAGTFSICQYAVGDEYLTPGAEYEMTCGGHRYNKEIADITTR